MSGAIALRPRKGAAFEALPGAVLVEGRTSVVLHARRVSGPSTLPEALVLKRATRGFDLLLQTERAVLERLDHPNVVRYLGAGESGRRGVLAFERLAPSPLALLNAEGARPRFRDPGTALYPLPPGRALELGFDLVQALGYLHSRGFVHGRVRPESLLVRVPLPGESPARILAQVAEGAFEGVLASPRNMRPLDWHERWRAGAPGATRIAPPERDPLYTPPDLLGPGPHPVASELAGDVYAAALVLYVLLTGRLPYDGLRRRSSLDRPEVVARLKRQEARGELPPVDADALDAIPLHDTALEGPRSRWIDFRLAVEHLLRRCLDRDPARRPSIEAVREVFESELALRWTLASGPRPWTQRIFQMRPTGNRLAASTDEGLTLRADRGAIVEERRALPRLRAEPLGAPRGAVVVRTERPAARTPRGLRPLTDLVPLARAGEGLAAVCPVLLMETAPAASELSRWLVFSLGRAATRLRITAERVEERRRVSVGRAPGNDIVLADHDVAKRHLRLEKREGRWWVEDLGAAHGTRVDGRRLRKGAPFGITGARATVELGARASLIYMDESALEGFVRRVALKPPR